MLAAMMAVVSLGCGGDGEIDLLPEPARAAATDAPAASCSSPAAPKPAAPAAPAPPTMPGKPAPHAAQACDDGGPCPKPTMPVCGTDAGQSLVNPEAGTP
jgi:hypothetical protein